MTATVTGSADDTRRRRLLRAGLVDSLGLSIGWTVLALHVVAVRGLQAFGTLSAAMLVGIALSAPITGWLASRMDGRRLLRTTAGGEAVLRLIAFALVFGGAPMWLIALAVVVSNILAWAGFAGMRTEVALLGGAAKHLAAYTAAIAAAEAAGAFIATSLPLGPDGTLNSTATTVAAVVYAVCVVPQFLVARGARAPQASVGRLREQLRGRGSLLAGGAMLTMLATGPTLLAVGLAVGLHGRGAVGPAMLFFAAGALTGPMLADWLGHLDMPVGVTWSFLGVLMLVGWGLAPVSVVGLLAAQLVSGVALGAFEGSMDARVADRGSLDTMTSGLAWAGSTRAIGSAVAVVIAPLGMQGFGIGRTAAAGTMVLAATAVGVGVGVALRGRRTVRLTQQQGLHVHGTSAYEPDWVAVLTTEAQEFVAISARYFGVDIHHVRDAAELSAYASDPAPLVAVLGIDAGEQEADALEALTGDWGPWASTRVRVMTCRSTPVDAIFEDKLEQVSVGLVGAMA